jgi:hypothetical protein
MESSNIREVHTSTSSERSSAFPSPQAPIATTTQRQTAEAMSAKTSDNRAANGDTASKHGTDGGDRNFHGICNRMIAATDRNAPERAVSISSSRDAPFSASKPSSGTHLSRIGSVSPVAVVRQNAPPSSTMPKTSAVTEVRQQSLGSVNVKSEKSSLDRDESTISAQSLASSSPAEPTAALDDSRRHQRQRRCPRNLEQARTVNNSFKCAEKGCDKEFKYPSTWQ